MKKFLSLVLALVMTMSLVTVSAGAKDFTDDSSITYKEAVDVISALGVVDGYSGGDFRPDDVLTRGAAAKIICNLILGPTTASALSAGTAPFKDVPVTNTFAGYITYCSQQGIISGYADGTFRPTGTLSGNAFMKMLLGALGYDSAVEGYTGANWTVAVIKQAVGIGLDDGNNEFVGSKAVTREEAALYSFNMLQATMVEYDAKTTVDINGATVTIAGDKAQDVVNSATTETIKNDDKMQFAEKYFDKLTKTRNDTDPFGRPANEWKYRSEIIGSYADYSDLLETYTAKAAKGDLFSLLGSSIVNGLDDGDYTLSVYVDGKEVSKPEVKDYFVKSSSSAAGVSGNGVLTEVYMDDDNNVTLVFVNTYLVKATADYNSKKESLSIETVEINTDTEDKDNPITIPSLGTTIDNEDVYVADFKEDDYILVTYSYDTKEIESAQLAEVVTGEVTEFTETSEVVMGGTTYKYNNLVGKTESRTEYTIGEDAKVVLDAYGYIIYIDEALSTNSYVFVKETDEATGVGNKVAADVYFTDGTNDAVILKKVAGETDKGSKLGAAGSWWTFSKDSNNQYTLNKVKSPLTADVTGTITAASTVVIKNDTIKFMPKVAGTYDSKDVKDVRGDSSTIFVVLEADGDVSAYTGVSNAPDIKTSETYSYDSTPGKENPITVHAVVKASTGYAEYVFIDLSNDADAVVEDSNTAADYLFLLKETGNKTTSGEDTYYKYKVVYDGVETEKYVESSLVADQDNGMLFRDVKENAKGYVTSAKEFDDADKRDVIGLAADDNDQIVFSNDTMTIAGKGYIIPSDCSVTLALGKNANLDLVNEGDDYTLYQGSARSAANLLKGYALDGTAYIAVDDTGSEVATTIYIWVENAVATEDDGDEEIPADEVVAKVGRDAYSSLEEAIAAAEDDDTITLTKNTTLETSSTLNEGVTLDGNGYTITYTGNKSAIIMSDDCVVENVTLRGTAPMNVWKGAYGIQAYNAKNTTISDVTIKGFNAAILVNGSETTLTDVVDVSSNGFGGIEVSKGEGVTANSVLTVEGTVINDTESSKAPTAWTECTDKNGDGAQGSVIGADWTSVVYEKKTPSSKYQIWWLIDSSNAPEA